MRLIVEQRKEIKLFKSEDYFQIFGNFEAGHPKGVQVKAKLISKDEVAYELKTTIKLFAGDYVYTKRQLIKKTLKT